MFTVDVKQQHNNNNIYSDFLSNSAKNPSLLTSQYTSSIYLWGGAMVQGKLPVPGRPTIWITVGQEPAALVVGVDEGCLDVFTLIYPFSSLPLLRWPSIDFHAVSKGR